MTAQQTSIDAFYDLKDTGELGRLQKTVLEYIRRHPSCSQSEAASFLGMGKEKVGPRFAELYTMGFIDCCGKRNCRITTIKVMVWKAIPKRDVKVICCPACKQIIRKEVKM